MLYFAFWTNSYCISKWTFTTRVISGLKHVRNLIVIVSIKYQENLKMTLLSDLHHPIFLQPIKNEIVERVTLKIKFYF